MYVCKCIGIIIGKNSKLTIDIYIYLVNSVIRYHPVLYVTFEMVRYQLGFLSVKFGI